MIKQFSISQILVFYDVPEVFLAKDVVGTSYLCLLVSDDNQLTYIAISISQRRLVEFIDGIVDLRDIFENPEIREWYSFNDISGPINATLFEASTLAEAYLPDPGFLYHREVSGEARILAEVAEKHNAVIHLAVSDQGLRDSIDVDNLGDVAKLYQMVIENSFKKVVAQQSLKDKRYLLQPQNYKLRAFASSVGSFNLHLYSTSQVDLFGNALIDSALRKFDEITQNVSSREEFINSLRTVKGHTIGNLKKLLKKVIDSNIKICHKWASPGQYKVSTSVIDKQKAQEVFSILNMSEELSEETKTFVGHFVQVDVERGTWRIFNIEDEVEYNGLTTGDILRGVTVETINYRIVCLEIIEELTVSEKEKVKYVLQTIDPQGPLESL